MDVTKFRKRTSSLETNPLKMELEKLCSNLRDEIPIKLSGFLQCLDVTEFRRRKAFLEYIQVRMEIESLFTKSGNKIPNCRIVNLLAIIALKPPARNVCSFCSRISQRTRQVISRLKTCFRWRKTTSLPELIVSLKELEFLLQKTMTILQQAISLVEHEFHREVKNRIFNIPKFKVCQY